MIKPEKSPKTLKIRSLGGSAGRETRGYFPKKKFSLGYFGYTPLGHV